MFIYLFGDLCLWLVIRGQFLEFLFSAAVVAFKILPADVRAARENFVHKDEARSAM
jgi:hypothetical protein